MSGDFRPTDQQVEVKSEPEVQLRDLAARVDTVIARDVAGYNELLRRTGVANVIGDAR